MITRNMKNRKPIFHSMKTRSMVAIEIHDKVEKKEIKINNSEKSQTNYFLFFLVTIPLISLFIYNKLFFFMLFFSISNICYPLF